MNGIQEVRGSTPLGSTNKINPLDQSALAPLFAGDHPAATRSVADPTVQLHAQITEGWARIAAEGGHAGYEGHPLFETVTDMEAKLASTPPQSVAGLILLLRQAFADLVPYHEGTERYEDAIECRTYGAVLLAIETLEAWQKAAAARQPDAPAEGRG